MKYLLIAMLVLIGGCATHPSNVEPVEITSAPLDCSEVAERVNTLSQKQEVSFAGDVILVSLIGLPLMPSYEDELATALGEWKQCSND